MSGQQQQKKGRVYGQWSAQREEALMLDFHPYSMKSRMVGKAYDSVVDAVNSTEPNLKRLSVSSIKNKINELISACSEKQHQIRYYGTGSNPSTSPLEDKIIELKQEMEEHKKKADREALLDSQQKEELRARKEKVAAQALATRSGKNLQGQIGKNWASGQNEASGSEPSRKRARTISDNDKEDWIKIFFEAKEDERVTFAKFLKDFREGIDEFVAETRRPSAEAKAAAMNQRNAVLMKELLCRQNGMSQRTDMMLDKINLFLAQLNNRLAIPHQQPSSSSSSSPPVSSPPPPPFKK